MDLRKKKYKKLKMYEKYKKKCEVALHRILARGIVNSCT